MTDEYPAEQLPETPAPPAPPGLRPLHDNEEGAPRRPIPVLPRGPLTANPQTASQGTPASPPAATPANSALHSPANTNPALNNPATPAAPPTLPGATPDQQASPAEDPDTSPEALPAGPAAEGLEEPGAPSLPISPQDAIGMATGAGAGALSAAMGIPGALMGAGMGLMAPFMAILEQFGQGSPAMPSSNGVPGDVLNSLAGINPDSAITGPIADRYQSGVDGQLGRATAMDDLEKKLRTALEGSASNATLGRDKIQQIIDQVKQSLQQLAPIANTPMGQAGVLTAITLALQQASAVLGNALSNDTLNAGTVESIASEFANATSTNNSSAANLAPLGTLTVNSTPQQVAAAIISEAQRRGYSPQQTVAILSTAMQESGLRPTATHPNGLWHGIFQQDGSYPGRSDPNTNISEFFNRLAAKGGPASPDIWKSIFWLTAGPGYLHRRSRLRREDARPTSQRS